MRPLKSDHEEILRHLSLRLASADKSLAAAKNSVWDLGTEEQTALRGETKPFSLQKETHLAV